MRNIIMVLAIAFMLSAAPLVAQVRPAGDDNQVAATCLGTLTYAVELIGDRGMAKKKDMNGASMAWYARVQEHTPDLMEFANKLLAGMEAAKRADGKSVGETSVWCMRNWP